MFISFEGIDFCGKTTQIELLKNYLESLSRKVFIIREPGGTPISEQIREILLNKKHLEMCDETEIFLFSGARAQVVRQKIRPLLAEGCVVIADRFHDSTTAYQGFGWLQLGDWQGHKQTSAGTKDSDLATLKDRQRVAKKSV